MLRDDAAFLANLAFIFTAPVGAPAPTVYAIANFDPDNPDALPENTAPAEDFSAWDHFGHTDLDEDIKADEEGGKSEVRGTRQRPNLRVRTEPVVETITISGVQFTGPVLRKHYGGGVETAGRFAAPATTKSIELATLIIYCDGDRRLGEYNARTSVKRGGPISREADNFMRAPIAMTYLSSGATGVTWINEDLFVAPGP